MTASKKPSKYYVGIDVSKENLDVACWPDQEVFSVKNDPDGIRRLIERLLPDPPELIVLEATGGMEKALLCALGAENLPVRAVNPRHVREFARATGQMAKTDRIDAIILARFGEAVKPEIRPLPDQKALMFSALSTRLEQLTRMIAMEKNHRFSAPEKLHGRIDRTLAHLEKERKKLEKEMDQEIRNSPIWKEKSDLLHEIPGVGDGTVRAVIANLPELGTLNRKQIAALVGLAPFPCESGAWKGQRHIWGGRKGVRKYIYMCALSGITYNPVIKEFFERLVAAGKNKKAAIVACSRKLLTIMNAVIRDQKPWDPEFSLQA